MREYVDSFTPVHGKKYYEPIATTIGKIKKTLQMHEDYSGKELVGKINNRTEQLLRYFFELKEIHHNDTNKLLPIVLNFIQNIYKNFGVTYFYNRSPDISYEEYDAYPIGQQVLNNIFDGKVYIKRDCLIKEDYVMWGSCHHWTLLIKKIFETIDLPWVTCIINKNLPNGHAFISIEYGSRTRVIDPLPQTQDLLEHHIYVMDEKQVMRFWTAEHNQALNPDMEAISQYEDRVPYRKNILNKLKHQSIKMKISTMELEIDRYNLVYKYRDFEKRQNVFRKKIILSKPISEYSKSELLQELFDGIKPIWGRDILPLVSKKISEEMLFSLFQ